MATITNATAATRTPPLSFDWMKGWLSECPHWMKGWLSECPRNTIMTNVWSMSPPLADGRQTCFVTDAKVAILATVSGVPPESPTMPENARAEFVQGSLFKLLAPKPAATMDLDALRFWLGPAEVDKEVPCPECKGKARYTCDDCKGTRRRTCGACGTKDVECRSCSLDGTCPCYHCSGHGKLVEPAERPRRVAGVTVNANLLARLLEAMPSGLVEIWHFGSKPKPAGDCKWAGLSLAAAVAGPGVGPEVDAAAWRVWLMGLVEPLKTAEPIDELPLPAPVPVPAGGQEQPQPAEHCRAICPDCGPVEVEPFGYDNGVPVAGECPKCRENIYFG